MNWAEHINRFEVLSLREQCLIGATVLAFFVSVLQMFVMDPMLAQQSSAEQRLSTLTASIGRKNQQLSGSGLTPLQTRQTILNTEIADVRFKLKHDQEALEQYTSALVPARKMPDLLQALLQQGALVSLENLPPVALMEAQPGEVSPSFQLYRHGIELQLRGDFHSLRRYLETIEKQSRKLLWQSVRLETNESGESLMELKIGTLSMDNAWLGV